MTRRNRLVSALLIGATVMLGLASRKFAALLPGWMAKNAGDVLYAVIAYWLAGFCFPRLSPVRTALAAGVFCFAIEFLKFSSAPWLVTARQSNWGALVVSLVCLVGIAWVFFQRRRMAKSAALDEQINAVERGPGPDVDDSLALNVTYRSTRETSWRCESYVATHQPASLCILGLFGLVVAFLLDDLIHQAYPAAGHFAFPFLWVAGSAAWLGFFCLLLQGILQQRFHIERKRHPTFNPPILFVLSDGEPTDGSTSQVAAAAEAMKNDGVMIVSCYVTDENITESRKLYSEAMLSWPLGAKIGVYSQTEK